MSKIELPPLPLDFSIDSATPRLMSLATGSSRLATAEECKLLDALRARDRQIVELCAQIAEDEDYRVDGRGWDDQLGDAQRTQWNIAAAIRALLDEKKEN